MGWLRSVQDRGTVEARPTHLLQPLLEDGDDPAIMGGANVH